MTTPDPTPPAIFQNPLYLHPSDGPGSLTVQEKLIGAQNYRAWRRAIEIGLSTKRKLGFIKGTVVRSNTDANLAELWDTCNNMVICWIMGSVSESIARSIMFVGTASEIWMQLERRFSLSDGSRKYKLNKDTYEITQSSGSVGEYYTKMKCVWEELDNLNVLPNVVPESQPTTSVEVPPDIVHEAPTLPENVDLCLSSPQKTNVHRIPDLFQHLHSVKSLALILEISELLFTSEEVVSHQPSPFPSLKSLKIYPLQGLKTWPLWRLMTCQLKSSLEIFQTQLDEEQEAMEIKLSAEVTNYFIGSSSNATFTMVSHEEARAIKITNAAHHLMADLWKILEEKEAYTETRRAKRKKTLADSCREDFKMKISPRYRGFKPCHIQTGLFYKSVSAITVFLVS
ncbi:hypothetical protein CTI12_AA087560 [Artemisia annua]|uniref:Retrotransposon Copia-like N-terminal domain-containing protein n=1 Tax=Artemisia annua TaxID=35608 RepID=A0A2U1Q1A9_ARTAN|nr:hypothetical protein CTI12_AA087560 [Artemisia annua]